MSFFGCFYFVWASVLIGGWRSPLLLIPVLVFAAIVWVSLQAIRRAGPEQSAPSKQAEKIITRATIFEGVGIPIVALGLANTGHGDIVLPGIAAVVGLHFLPMAYAIPFRPFYALGTALLVGSGSGFAMMQPLGSIVAGLVGALALWAASVMALWRARHATSPTLH